MSRSRAAQGWILVSSRRGPSLLQRRAAPGGGEVIDDRGRGQGQQTPAEAEVNPGVEAAINPYCHPWADAPAGCPAAPWMA